MGAVEDPGAVRSPDRGAERPQAPRSPRPAGLTRGSRCPEHRRLLARRAAGESAS